MSIKPLAKCNLSCVYCNLPVRSKSVLRADHVSAFFSALVRTFPGQAFRVSWGGGEPLLMGVEFFQAVLHAQKQLRAVFENEISTNLTLLNDRYVDLFAEYDVSIFTSLDGIGRPHDLQRSGSFGKVAEALGRLKKAGIVRVFANTVVTRHNCDALKAVYAFCVSQALGWNFTPVVPSGVRRSRAEAMMADPRTFSATITEIFDHWLAAESPIDVLVFADAIRYIIGRDDYVRRNDPQLTLGTDGKLYSCRLLAGDSRYSLGRFSSGAPMKVPSCSTCSFDIQGTGRQCESCYFDYLCNLNHCAYLHEVYSRSSAVSDYLCQCFKPVFTHILAAVQRVALEHAAA